MSDLNGCCFIKRANTLIPADFVADEFLASLKEGREIILSIRKPRSPKHHRWFRAMLVIVVRSTGWWESDENLLEDLKIVTGYFDRIINIFTGEIRLRGKSTNFGAMDEDQFLKFRQRCVAKLAEKGIDAEALMEEVRVTQGEFNASNAARAVP